jgi:succinylglutamate desuccinylase
MNPNQRLIGQFSGEKGPLILTFGAVHGNEPAGVKALSDVFSLLEAEKSSNPDFIFKGCLMGILGNKAAYQSGQRFIDRDLNRQWMPEYIRRIYHQGNTLLCLEDQEMIELLDLIHAAITDFQPTELILLDLHTTSAGGGIFCIPTDDHASLRLSKAIEAPVVLGLLEGIEGTLLQFGSSNHFQINGFPKQTLGVAFESGQHDDPDSSVRSAAAIIQCLRACGCLDSESLGWSFIQVLKKYSDVLPKVTQLLYVHHIRPGDQFKMRPGYANFQAVRQGEHLADDITGPIFSAHDGLILMPLYQAKGSDGFFLVESLKE